MIGAGSTLPPMRLRLLGPVIALLVAGVTATAVTGCGGSSKHTSTSATAARGPLPGGVVGVTFNGPAVDGQVNVGQQLDLAVASGVESLRVSFNWAATQPYRSYSQVPAAQRSRFVDVNGVPTRFAPLDEIVGAAAARGLTILPVVERTPRWDAPPGGNTGSTPISAAPYAAFLTALVKRYGPNGTFWAAHPSIRAMPIRMWQIWNEPHFTSYWSQQPFAPSYVRLLRAAHDAIRAADPSAKVVLAGLADISWQYLAQIYMVPGARSLFDVVAIHPYTAKAAGVIIILKKVRAVMARFGDRDKPILATEITWPSSQGKAPPQFGVSTTEAQQAQRLDQVMPMLADDRAQLGLMGFYWYTWMGDEGPDTNPYAFNFAGLLKYVRGTVSPKPALGVFKRRALEIERCRRKGSNAETCA
jgi:hypothetical protein